MLKQNKGITLVALVITIIVLLILAGVSISMVVGENGVLNRATGAAKATTQADVEQELQSALVDAQAAFTDIWLKNNKARFLEDYLKGEKATELGITAYTFNIDGYAVSLGNLTPAKNEGEDNYEPASVTGTIQKNKSATESTNPNTTYGFKLTAKGKMGAEITTFQEGAITTTTE